MVEMSENTKLLLLLFGFGLLCISYFNFVRYLGKASQHRSAQVQTRSIHMARLQRAAGPAVFIASIWASALDELGYKLPRLIGWPVGVLLLVLLFWSMPFEMNPSLRAWWRSVQQNRYFSLSFMTMAVWVCTAGILRAYIVGTALLATIVLVYFTWAAWREAGTGNVPLSYTRRSYYYLLIALLWAAISLLYIFFLLYLLSGWWPGEVWWPGEPSENRP